MQKHSVSQSHGNETMLQLSHSPFVFKLLKGDNRVALEDSVSTKVSSYMEGQSMKVITIAKRFLRLIDA